MTSRNDYVPGDVATIQRVAGSIGELGEDFGDARRELQSVAETKDSSSWFGAAATQFETAIEGLPGDLGQMSSAHGSVARALKAYATKLADLQRSADRAIEALGVKRQERDANGARADSARSRLASLTMQLAGARTAEVAAGTAYRTAQVTPVPGAAGAAYQVYESARRTVIDLSGRRGAAQEEERKYSRLEAEARAAVERYQDQLDDLRESRQRAERLCADQIRSALPRSLKNPGMYEKAKGWVGDQVEKVVDLVEAVWDLMGARSWEELLSGIRNVAKALAEVMDLVAIGLVVAAAVVTVVTGGAALPLAAVLLKGAMALWKFSKIANSVSLVAGLSLAASGAKIDGRRVVTWGEVGADGVGVALSYATGKLMGGKNHFRLAARGANSFSAHTATLGGSESARLAQRIFNRDFSKRVLLPHLGQGFLDRKVKGVVTDPLKDGVGHITDGWRRQPWEDLEDQVPVSTIVDGALGDARPDAGRGGGGGGGW